MAGRVNKEYVFDYLQACLEVGKNPVVIEDWYGELMETCSHYGKKTLSDRDLGKLREYVREFSKTPEVMDRTAGGVIYPKKVRGVGKSLTIHNDSMCKYGLSELWMDLAEHTLTDGIRFGNRISLASVFIYEADIRLGNVHYKDVGYSPSKVLKTWSEYFGIGAVANFRGELELRTGFSKMFRCSYSDNGCLDSITVVWQSKRNIKVHANFRVSNVTRMNLMDWYILHRFVRMVIPPQYLGFVSLSAYFGTLTFDLPMYGWLSKLPGQRGKDLFQFAKSKARNAKVGDGFKSIDLAREFSKSDGSGGTAGVEQFFNTMYGLGVIPEYDSSKIYYEA